MSLEIQGKILKAYISGSGVSKTTNEPWEVQTVVLETLDPSYPKKVAIEVFGEKIGTLNIKEGETIRIKFDLESSEYNGRWYTRARAWGVERDGMQTPAQGLPSEKPTVPSFPNPSASAAANQSAGVGGGQSDGLPF